MNELLKVKEELTKERDENNTTIVKLREQMAEAEGKQKKLEESHEDAKQKIQEVHTKLWCVYVNKFNVSYARINVNSF